MARGIQASRDLVDVFPESSFPTRRHMIGGYDAHVFYGLEGHLPQLFAAAIEESRAVYIDLGYWGRREGGRYQGFHKVSVNARHPSAYYRFPAHAGDRFRKFGIPVDGWHWRGARVTGKIILAGMGAKGAAAEGFGPQEWERAAVEAMRPFTSREIIYRPKPSDPLAAPIPGTTFSKKTMPVEELFSDAWAVVTHHSNVAVDALLAGIPVFCWGGVAREMGLQDFARIEDPHYPEDRAQWAADIAYTQWSVPEMAAGHCWQHLKSDALV